MAVTIQTTPKTEGAVFRLRSPFTPFSEANLSQARVILPSIWPIGVMITMQQTTQPGSTQSPRSSSAEDSFLAISVTEPVKLGNGVQAYVSYRVITKTNFPDYQGPEKIVIRRYSDFVWLRDCHFETYKGYSFLLFLRKVL